MEWEWNDMETTDKTFNCNTQLCYVNDTIVYGHFEPY